MTGVAPEAVAEALRAALRAPQAGPTAGLTVGQLGGRPCEMQLGFRAKGVLLARAWGEGPSLTAALRDAVLRANPALDRLTHVDISLAHTPRLMQQSDLSRAESNRFRGLHGIEVAHLNAKLRMGPLELLTRNLGPRRAILKMAAELGVAPERAVVRAFGADQFLMDWPLGRIARLYRGQTIVPQFAITRAATARMAQAMEDWMLAQVSETGATTYKYWPSAGKYSTAQNMIRQFMGSAALARIARRRQDPLANAATARNFAHNFQHFYAEEDGLGLIHEGEKIKLGAAAVALIAALDRQDPNYSAQIHALARFVLSMQLPNGRFRTFLRPADRDDCQNFYPGEACLALMRLYAETRDPALAQAVTRAFHHYRDWHLADPNPAFVPWFTMALCLLHKTHPNPDIPAFVFQMTDWLLPIQQGADAPPDVQGEFFDPARPEFGPPHASATGVYLEGLIEAWALADAMGDPRALPYRRAILAGLRSLTQLQFRDGDMFYIAAKRRVRGALRTTAHDNTIRLDNVQHGLMAIQRILDLWDDSHFAA